MAIVERAQELSALGMEGDVRLHGDDMTVIIKIVDPALTPYVPEFRHLIIQLARLG